MTEKTLDRVDITVHTLSPHKMLKAESAREML